MSSTLSLIVSSQVPRASAAQLAAPLIQSVLALLPSLSSEVAQTVLDTLIVALELSPAATAQLEPAVTASLLQLWQKHVADTMLTASVVDAFVTVACIKEASIGLAVRDRDPKLVLSPPRYRITCFLFCRATCHTPRPFQA